MSMPTVYEFDVSDLVMSSTAYYLGRRTANVSDFCSRLCLSWDRLPLAVQAFVTRIVEEAFAREGAGAACALGDACDRAAWERVRHCWAGRAPSGNAEHEVPCDNSMELAFLALWGYCENQFHWSQWREELRDGGTEPASADAANVRAMLSFMEAMRHVPVVRECLQKSKCANATSS